MYVIHRTTDINRSGLDGKPVVVAGQWSEVVVTSSDNTQL